MPSMLLLPDVLSALVLDQPCEIPWAWLRRFQRLEPKWCGDWGVQLVRKWLLPSTPIKIPLLLPIMPGRSCSHLHRLSMSDNKETQKDLVTLEGITKGCGDEGGTGVKGTPATTSLQLASFQMKEMDLSGGKAQKVSKVQWILQEYVMVNHELFKYYRAAFMPM